MEQRASQLGRVQLRRTGASRRTAHICLAGAVRDVAIQAVGGLDFVTDEVSESEIVAAIKSRSRLVILGAPPDRMERLCRRMRSTRGGWSLTIVLVAPELADRGYAARMCQRLDADIGLPNTAPRALFMEMIERALVRRAPLTDFGILPSETASHLDELFGGMGRRDYYELFGLAKTADEEAIRERFHRLAELTHPDRYRSLLPENEMVFSRIETIYKRLSEAHGVLNDPVRRALYDLCLRTRGTIRYDPEALGIQARRELAVCVTDEAKLEVARSLVARSVGQWASAEDALRRAMGHEAQNAGLKALAASVSKIRTIADYGLKDRGF